MLATYFKHHPFNWMYTKCAWPTNVTVSVHYYTHQLDSHLSIRYLGGKSHLQADIMFLTNKPESQSSNLYAATIKNQLPSALDTAHKQIGRQCLHQKAHYDKKLRDSHT